MATADSKDDNLLMHHYQALIRLRLNDDKIQLWKPPFTNENGDKGPEPVELVEKYSSSLHISTATVSDILERLRVHAIQKLKSREKFQKYGTATLKIRTAGPWANGKNTKVLEFLETQLKINGLQLKTQLSEMCGILVERLKLIAQGHLIQDDRPLQEQNIKNGSLIFVICLSESEAQARKQEESFLKVVKAREDAEILSAKTSKDYDYYLQIADQTGKPLKLPPEERKALALAMTLNEKGRATLKRKKYGEALLLLLEADKEFRKCSADILNGVDNYAVLCLDIVWCYFCLKNIDELPDAENRLRSCEECFNKSYGADLERLAAVKGETSKELALLVRLHLLQGILAFHQQKLDEAQHYFSITECELKKLKVDENKLMQIVSMGFQDTEARLALRACRGDIDAAVAHITKKHEEKIQLKKEEQEERVKARLSNKLGKTVSGELVNVDNYRNMLQMGYCKSAVCEALRQSNNDITLAIEIIQKHPEFYSLPDPESTNVNITEEIITQVTEMGFQPEIVREALEKYGDVARVVNILIEHHGMLPPSSSSSSATQSDSSPEPLMTPEEKKREKDAIDSIAPDIPEDEEEYLNLSLDEEAQVLRDYKEMINSIS